MYLVRVDPSFYRDFTGRIRLKNADSSSLSLSLFTFGVVLHSVGGGRKGGGWKQLFPSFQTTFFCLRKRGTEGMGRERGGELEIFTWCGKEGVCVV